MSKLFVAFLACFSAFVTTAATDAATKKSNYEKRLANEMKYLGGRIQDRRSAKGNIVLVNAQHLADQKLLAEACSTFTAVSCVDIKIQEGSFDVMEPTLKGEGTLFLIDNDKLPMSLFAPEAKWAMVNVSRLKSDKKPFFEARIKKETFRLLCYLCGVGGTKYAHCITGIITKAEDLDEIPEIKVPVEFKERFNRYLPGCGIIPFEVVYYKRACEQGWAPPPTNDYQKAIWDKVHAIPEKPMKIKFDPATQKGKVTK